MLSRTCDKSRVCGVAVLRGAVCLLDNIACWAAPKVWPQHPEHSCVSVLRILRVLRRSVGNALNLPFG
eukprot:4443448-Lingulodinium_polyedra.AAC.1